MVSTLILTHGGLAAELLRAAQAIAGPLPSFSALCLDWNDTAEAARTKVAAAICELDTGDGVIILTDLYGGTPNNVACGFKDPGRVEVLTGVNLPMVLRLGCRSGGGCAQMAVGELSRWLEGKGRESVRRIPCEDECGGEG